MLREILIIIFFALQITKQNHQTYEYKFKIWINKNIIVKYGGNGSEIEKREHIQSLIKQQWLHVNEYYNSQVKFQNKFRFIPSKFSFFDDVANESHMDNIDFHLPLPDDDCNYRIIYSHSPYNTLIHSDYFNRSIRFSINPEYEWNETIWDRYSTRILIHELAHSRGAYDLYAVNVNGNQNQVFYGMNYKYPIPSVMNYLYDLNTNFDELSIYVINRFTGQVVTPTMTSDMFWSTFPRKFGIFVKDMFNNPIGNVQVVFYGVRWLQENVNVNDRFDRKTDQSGKVTFNGNEITTNPYQRYDSNSLGIYSNFLVVVYNEGNGLYNWLPVFLVQTAKIQNKTEYYLEYQFNRKPIIEFLYLRSNSLNISIPQQINSFDLTCQIHYTQVTKLNFSINASDIDGYVNRIEFYINNQLVSQLNKKPYVYEWFISTNGSYTIFARVYDNYNQISDSKKIFINVFNDDSNIENGECRFF